MDALEAEKNGGRCPVCGGRTARDLKGTGRVKHLERLNVDVSNPRNEEGRCRYGRKRNPKATESAKSHVSENATSSMGSSSRSSSQDGATIQRLLEYLPFLSQPDLKIGGPSARWKDTTLTIYPAEYIDEINDFFSLVAPPFTDTNYLEKPVAQWLLNPEFLENASLEQVRTVLTWVCRGERFCSGAWTEHFENGNLVRALRRLQSLQDVDFCFDEEASKKVAEDAKNYIVAAPEVIELTPFDVSRSE